VWAGAAVMNRRNRHNYLTVFAELLAKQVIFATPAKNAMVWEASAEDLQRHNAHSNAI
jgi:hypothetical protein